MPLNLIKKYNQLLDIAGLSPVQRDKSLRGVFNRDNQDNLRFFFNGKPIFPTPKENGQEAMESLFTHLTCREADKDTHHREFELSRSQRLHWIRFHIDGGRHDGMYVFSVAEPKGDRTYIYDENEHYLIVLEPLRKVKAYYLLTAYPLEGKDLAKNKIIGKYNRRRLPYLL
ncbi:MAG: hypothetical protein K2J00_06745 [Bacteroidaceae bacterium]|nr:hypothetical protein [Bacteroidaceae bacterium]